MGKNQTPQNDTALPALKDWLSFCPFEIVLASDLMSARLQLQPLPINPKNQLSPAELIELAGLIEKRVLERAASLKITYGFKEDVLSKIRVWIETQKASTIILAQGKEPVHGADGILKLLFLQKKTIKPEANSQNLRDLHYITNLPKGTPLARYTKAKVGVSGWTVTHEELPAKTGEEKKIRVSTLIKAIDEANDCLRYETAEEVMLEKISEEELSVTQHITIDSDIDYHTGNIDACGSITIRGSVRPNFIVKSSQNITIDGNIESAYVEAKGSLKVSGILGKIESTVVKSGKTLDAQFIQNARVSSRGNLHVRESVVNSEIASEGDVEVMGGAGAIVTSRALAASHIEASIFGSSGEGRVMLVAGVNPKLWQGLERQKRELNFSKRMTLRGAYRLQKNQNRLTRSFWLRQSKKQRFAAILERSIKRKEKNILSDLVSKKELPFVKANQKVYSNIHIKIGPYEYRTTQVSDGKTFQPDLQHGIIKAS